MADKEHIRSLDEILAIMTSKDSRDVDLVSRAYAFAQEAHKEHKRYSGDPYFSHTAEVAFLLAEAGMDAVTVAAGFLHDTIEDAHIKREVVKTEFGAEVLSLVDGVTKLGAVRFQGAERHIESLRKLFAATARDIRVLIIKLYDRLHNARTFSYIPDETKRLRIARETLEIYVPIADRLGMSLLKQQLEDASFPYTHPHEYEKTRELLKERKAETEKRLEKTEKALKRELSETDLKTVRTEARIKGVYSLFRKLERKEWDIHQIYDILALRVILPTISDCYTALGIIHAHWRPIPGKIKDYIASPKPNGYRSIHTTIYTGDGGALEIQLRTEEMHREALYGIASHLAYKEIQRGAVGTSERRVGLDWIRQFFPYLTRTQAAADSHQSTLKDKKSAPGWIVELAHTDATTGKSEHYFDSLKEDFFSHRIFAFTPKNDAIDMPIGATPIDFAYAVHSDLGNHMYGARVNGKMVALGTSLRNGDRVEIISKPSAKPSRKWVDIAKTNLAKKHIRSALSAQEKK